MKLPSQRLLFVAVIVVLALTMFRALAADPNQADPARTRWEHLALTHNSANVNNDAELSKQIIRLGDEGWQLVAVTTTVKEGTTDNTVFCFKRPK